jgi:hypothetical protein
MTDHSSTSSSEPASDRRALFAALGLAAALLGVDRLARVEPPFADFGDDLKPFAQASYAIEPDIAPGLSPRSRFFRNAQGLRGHVLSGSPDDVLLVGGSTVACTLLDQRDALGPAIERALDNRVRVAALGRGGYPLERLRPLVDRALDDVDLRPGTLVLLLGANEVEMLMNHLPWTDGPAWDEHGPFGPAERAKTFAGWYRPDADGRFLLAPRRAYATSPQRDHLTTEQARLVVASHQQFGAQLTALVRAARAVQVEVVLVTQPLAYDVARGETHPGWAPFFYAEPGSGVLPTPALMHSMLDGFNRVVRDVGANEGVEVVDLAPRLAACAACFYDQWHFTIAGATSAGTEIAGALAPR